MVGDGTQHHAQGVGAPFLLGCPGARVGGVDDTSAHAVIEHVGLVVDFLEHEVWVAPFGQHVQVQVDLLDQHVGLLAVEVEELHVLASLQQGYLFIVQVTHVLGVLGDGTGIAGHEEFLVLLPDTHHHGRGLAGTDQLLGMTLVDDADGVGTDDFLQGDAHGRDEVIVAQAHGVVDELHQHLRVRLGTEGVTSLQELLAQGGVVLYDAVVDEGEVSRL